MAKSPLSLERLLNTPQLDRIVPLLQPGVLHRVIQHYGLEDCAELVALASPAQVARLLDEDVWRVRAGADAAFDVERFGLWLVVLMQSGVEAAADKLAGIDTDLVVAGLAGHISAFDRAAVSSYISLDGDFVEGREPRGSHAAEIGGYLMEAKRSTAWDVIVELLTFLDGYRPGYFERLMHGCVQLSNGEREPDGFHDLLPDRDQALFDVRGDRDARRDALGYVTPAQARAFLLEAWNLRLDSPAPPVSFSARAHFRGLESVGAPVNTATRERQAAATVMDAGKEADAEAGAAALVDLLTDAGVLRSEPRALLGAASGEASRFASIQAHVAAHESAAAELAFLANALMEGSTVDGRAFSPKEASDAAAAACNLGLEHWPGRWQQCDLIVAFQVGWQVLHRDVCMFTAKQLIGTLADLPCHDRDIQLQVAALRAHLSRAIEDDAPWRVRQELDVLLLLDAASWAAVRGLIGECPIMNAVMRPSASRHAIRTGEFDFIVNRGDVAVAQQFVEKLPVFLTR